jgi:hypothetical protein
MVSTCPHCQRKVTHEDHLFEVSCQCGSSFNPFATSGDLPPMEPSLDAIPSDPDDFAESSSVFNELVNFGEQLETIPDSLEAPALVPKPLAHETKSAPTAKAAASLAGGQITLVASHGLEGYKIETQLGLVSVSSSVDIDGDDPFGPLFSGVSAKAEALGGNAVVSLQWWLAPDGNRAVATGSVVRCAKCE